MIHVTFVLPCVPKNTSLPGPVIGHRSEILPVHRTIEQENIAALCPDISRFRKGLNANEGQAIPGGSAASAMRRDDPTISRRIRPGVEIACHCQIRTLRELLRGNPLRHRFAGPWFFMACIVTVTNNPTVRVLVVLKGPSKARTGAHVRGAVLLDSVKRVGTDPNRV